MKDAKLSRRTIPPRQAAFAKAMRRDMTGPERKLWKALRWRLLVEGTHFRRQVSLGPYIADFCSYGAKIVIEVDGDQHGMVEAGEQDAIRTAFMAAQGYRVLRFSNRDVMLHIDIVLDTIAAVLSSTSTPSPTPDPSPRGGGEVRGDNG
jgi:very-short-patch-repair endonuclease